MAPGYLDPSVLMVPPRQSALSRGMQGTGDLLSAMLERRQRQHEAIAESERAMALKQEQLKFQREQEARVLQHQKDQDKFQRDKFDAEQRAAAGKETYEAYAKHGAEGAGIVASGYGGKVAPRQPTAPFTQPDDSPLGFSVTDEYEEQASNPSGHVLQMPGGAEVDLGKGQAQAAHFSRLRASLERLPPGPIRDRELRSLDEAEAAALDGKGTLEYLEKGRAGQRQMDIAAMRKKTGGGAPSARQGQKDLNQQLLTEGKYDGIVQKVLTNKGYKEINTSGVKMADMASTIAGASDNAALAAIGGGQFVKMAQGGTGVISDSDMRVFWSKIGGLGVRGEQAFNDAMSGRLGEDKKNAVLAAVQQLEAKAKANMNDIGSSIASRLSSTPGGEAMIPTYLQTYAPDYLPVWQSQRAQGKSSGTGTAKGVPKALAPADLARLKALAGE